MPTDSSTSRKAVFLDRDGTLNFDRQYLIDFGDFELIPGVESALKRFQDLGYRLFVVSNQSGVARGYFSYEAVVELNRRIADHLRERGIRIEEIAFCPHHPEGKDPRYARDCECRKPKPGMLHYLRDKYDLDLKASYMVGDKPSDAETGVNAGATGIWLSGTGEVDNPRILKNFDSLLDFAGSLREID